MLQLMARLALQQAAGMAWQTLCHLKITLQCRFRYSKDKPRLGDTLEIIKFLCKEFWLAVFKKQVDNLRTNHRVRTAATGRVALGLVCELMAAAAAATNRMRSCRDGRRSLQASVREAIACG
jgi:hypothetical protein